MAAGYSFPDTIHILGAAAVSDNFNEFYYHILSSYPGALTNTDSEILTRVYRDGNLIFGTASQKYKNNCSEY